jgi:hypothetical protein
MGLCVTVIYEVERVKKTTHFKWHNGGVTVSTIWTVYIKWELPNKGLTFQWNFIRDIAASGGTQNATEPNSIRDWQSI